MPAGILILLYGDRATNPTELDSLKHRPVGQVRHSSKKKRYLRRLRLYATRHRNYRYGSSVWMHVTVSQACPDLETSAPVSYTRLLFAKTRKWNDLNGGLRGIMFDLTFENFLCSGTQCTLLTRRGEMQITYSKEMSDSSFRRRKRKGRDQHTCKSSS